MASRTAPRIKRQVKHQVKGRTKLQTKLQAKPKPAPKDLAVMRVESLMSTSVVCCRVDEPISAAARSMWDHDCGVVVVVSRDGLAVGTITDRDICMATWMRDRPPSLIPAIEVMSRELYTCAPTDRLAVAERLMRSRQVRRIPVLDDDGRPVGILSLADLVREAERPQGRAQRVVPEEIAATLAEICHPRDASAASMG